jgi:ribonuclease HI
MAIRKAIEHIQYLKAGEKITLVFTDSRITLQLLQNQNKHIHLIELIGTKVIELERDERKVALSWIKAHLGHRGNEMADQLVKEAASSRTIDGCYTRHPKGTVLCDLNLVLKL